jgi:hypothetical protein
MGHWARANPAATSNIVARINAFFIFFSPFSIWLIMVIA